MSHHHEHSHDGHQCCGHDHTHEHDHEHKEQTHSDDAGVTQHHHDHSHVHSEACGHDHVHDDAAWTRQFFAFLQAVVLLMIGGIMCYFVASGRIDGQNPQAPYVTGWFRVLVLCGGLGIMVMGVFNWLMRNRAVDCGHDHVADQPAGCCGDATHDHGDPAKPHVHSHEGSVLGRSVTLLLLSGSVAAATMLTPDQLSSRYVQYKAVAYGNDRNSTTRLAKESPGLAAAKSQGGLTLEKVEQYLKRTKDGNFPLSVMNLHYMGSDPEYATVMEGQMVETTGQVVKDEINPGPGHLRVVTMQVTCCAADARPYSIPIIFEGGAPEYVEMGWYNIVGKLEFTRERGMKMAILKATTLTATMRPPEQRTIF
jgi:uncharacterized membrane protein YcgQ (UPF0703/DUF1980 family)